MANTLVVPASLEEIVQNYDAKEEPFTEFDIGGALKSARNALIDPRKAENRGAWAEALAFALVTGRHHENPWNSYFGPMASGTDGQGATVYFPDIIGTPAETVTHWAARARSLKHPFLKARYADLAWEMSGPIGNRRRDCSSACPAPEAVSRRLDLNTAGVSLFFQIDAALHRQQEPSHKR
jgi:hypothetical protein